MKKIFTLTFLFIITLNFAQVKWMTIEEALNAQKTQPKKSLSTFMQIGVAHAKSWIKNLRKPYNL